MAYWRHSAYFDRECGKMWRVEASQGLLLICCDSARHYSLVSGTQKILICILFELGAIFAFVLSLFEVLSGPHKWRKSS